MRPQDLGFSMSTMCYQYVDSWPGLLVERVPYEEDSSGAFGLDPATGFRLQREVASKRPFPNRVHPQRDLTERDGVRDRK